MGHSREMNKNTYQAPLAVMGITKVGSKLAQIDNCKFNLTNSTKKILKAVLANVYKTGKLLYISNGTSSKEAIMCFLSALQNYLDRYRVRKKDSRFL